MSRHSTLKPSTRPGKSAPKGLKGLLGESGTPWERLRPAGMLFSTGRPLLFLVTDLFLARSQSDLCMCLRTALTTCWRYVSRESCPRHMCSRLTLRFPDLGGPSQLLASPP